MDWSAWLKSRCRSRSRWYVYLAFAGAGFHGKDGWSGKSRTVFRTGRKRKSTRFCADRCAAIYFYGTGLRYFMPHFCPAMVGFFKLNEPRSSLSRIVLYENCLRTDCIFFFNSHVNRNLYRTGRFKNTISLPI